MARVGYRLFDNLRGPANVDSVVSLDIFASCLSAASMQDEAGVLKEAQATLFDSSALSLAIECEEVYGV